MRLRLSELDNAAKLAIKNYKEVQQLKAEVRKIFGYVADTERTVEGVCSVVNDQIQILRSADKDVHCNLNVQTLKKLAVNESVEARKLAANLLPLHELSNLLFDKENSVRSAAAKRAPAFLVKGAAQMFDDDQMFVLLEEKKQAKKSSNKKDNTGKFVDLSDHWYDEQARMFLQDYNNEEIDHRWKEKAIKQFCSSIKAISNVEIDEEKLLDAIIKQIKTRDDEKLDEAFNTLKETANWLRTL